EDLFDELERSTAESLSHTVLITDRAANGMRAILEGRGRDAVQNKDAETHGTVELKVTKYSPDSIEVSVSLPHPRMLVVTNNYSPFWRAYVNGVDTAIIPTYGSFWGVALAEGQHHVVFQYEP
ncbi:MAG: YfhO family protein, partial [Gammaproteobacteria bacterium]|nr:YfhO family protein [Gammaproteobacteria bacterium]